MLILLTLEKTLQLNRHIITNVGRIVWPDCHQSHSIHQLIVT